ncbi:MAG TPA: polymorphic toxin-type HINT domain-containing protein, partial [Actinoplanes sp.]
HTTAGNNTTTYNYGENGHPPHALTSTSTPKTVTTPAVNNTYGYDALGNTVNRPGPRGSQTLTWDAEGRLQSLHEPATPPAVASGTGYLYDADGALLIRRPTAGNGETVLYLGATEVHLTTGATPKLTGARYYSSGEKVVAVRTSTKGTPGTKIDFLAGDHHATASLAVNGTVTNGVAQPQTYTKRYTTPFGAPRGPRPAWPDDKTFLGKPVDTNTGLTHVGAREYDPGIGRFISVDPVLDTSNAQSLNGYAYADNNPVTFSDPTGLMRPPMEGGGSGLCDSCRAQPSSGGSSSGGSGGSTSSGGSWSGGSTSSGASTTFNSPKKPFLRAIASGIAAGAGDFVRPFVDTYHEFKEDPWGAAVDQAWGVLNAGTTTGQLEAGLASAKKLYAGAKAVHDGDAEQATRIATERTLTVAAAVAPLKLRFKAQCDSFEPGTLVLMANGTTKPIHDIELGDRVLATDPETGETVEQEVTDLHDNVDHEFVAVEVADDDGRGGVIHTTSHHPFWNETHKRWTDASELRVRDRLYTTTDRTVRVSALQRSIGSRRMLNLTVANFNTYYVVAGDTPVLVHNCGGSIWTSTKSKTAAENAYGHYKKHGAEFSDVQNSLQYVNKARDWFANPSSSVRARTRGNGDVVRFDPNTDYFGVMTRDGTPKTFFVPDPTKHGYATNLDYFNAQ